MICFRKKRIRFGAERISFYFSSMHGILACALCTQCARCACVSSEDSLPKVCSGTLLVQVQGRRDFIEEEFTKVKLHQVLK